MAYRIAMQGYDPKSPEIRRQLKLPLPSVQVISVQGFIPDGAQALEARRCACGAWFIPNGTRKRCYNCLLPKAQRDNGNMKRDEMTETDRDRA
ncbi:MAG: hypothetical protein M5R40_07245 [Anaerolineae bacterium]|nr:hypothetical protein [Anaerolineae bacterium]